MDGVRDEDSRLMPLEEHLAELRTRLLRSAAVFMLVFPVCLAFSARLLGWLLSPAGGVRLVYLEPLEPFFCRMKAAAVGAFLLSAPWWLMEAWRFVSPGLSAAERRFVAARLPLLALAAAGGAAFGWFLLLPLGLRFLAGFASAGPGSAGGAVMMWSVSACLDFFLSFTLACSLLAELPLLLSVAIRAGLVDVDTLRRSRPQVVIGVFLAAALVTPPDVLTQILVALPVWLGFEAALFFGGGE